MYGEFVNYSDYSNKATPVLGVAIFIQFSANVYILQDGVQRVIQPHFVVVSLLFVADDGLPFDQALNAVPEFPRGHPCSVQQSAVGHFLGRILLQNAQDLPFLIQLASFG